MLGAGAAVWRQRAARRGRAERRAGQPGIVELIADHAPQRINWSVAIVTDSELVALAESVRKRDWGGA